MSIYYFYGNLKIFKSKSIRGKYFEHKEKTILVILYEMERMIEDKVYIVNIKEIDINYKKEVYTKQNMIKVVNLDL